MLAAMQHDRQTTQVFLLGPAQFVWDGCAAWAAMSPHTFTRTCFLGLH